MKKILLFLFIGSLLLVRCNTYTDDIANESASASYEGEVASRSTASAPEAIPVGRVAESKKVIKTGRMGIQVAELSRGKGRVDSLVGVYGGYYSRESLSESQTHPSITLSIRIPGANYERFVSALESGQGKTLYKEISARDVTEEYLDVETRLATKRTYLERYREILKRATSIKEMLDVEEYIRRLEEEIESAEGRLRFLDSQVSYSTLELTRSTEYTYTPVVEKNRFGQRLKKALSVGWDGIVTFLLGLLYLWPFLILGGIVLVWWSYKRKKNTKK